jgi:Zn-finger nucleic acid-binding protein
MQCPSCQSVLVMSERKGVEIDYCPQCRGVWLDRGELDKIIDRALDAEIAAETRGAGSGAPVEPAAVTGAPVPPLPPVPPSYGGDRGYDRRYDDKRYDDKRYDDKRYDEPRYDERRYEEHRYDKRHDDRYRRDDEYRRRKKKDSFLGDLFDF